MCQACKLIHLLVIQRINCTVISINIWQLSSYYLRFLQTWLSWMTFLLTWSEGWSNKVCLGWRATKNIVCAVIQLLMNRAQSWSIALFDICFAFMYKSFIMFSSDICGFLHPGHHFELSFILGDCKLQKIYFGRFGVFHIHICHWQT